MSGKQLRKVDVLSGDGFLIDNNNSSVPVRYNLTIMQEMMLTIPGGPEVGGLFRMSGSVNMGSPADLGLIGESFILQISDGTEIEVIIKSGSFGANTLEVCAKDVSNLTDRYKIPDQ